MESFKEEGEAVAISDDYADLCFSHLHGWLNRTPQFLMYVYKVKTCQRSVCYFPKKPCPFLHDGELGRRDLLRHKYSCVPCLEFKNGFCPHGIACGHAHGVLEERFHPMLFRTRYCWYMTSCKRKDCSYAHKEEEKRAPTVAPFVPSLRPLKPSNSSSAALVNNVGAKNPVKIYPTHSMMQTLWRKQAGLLTSNYPLQQQQQRSASIGYVPSSSDTQSFCGSNDGDDHDQYGNFDRLSGENENLTATNLHNNVNGVHGRTPCYSSSSSITTHSSQWGFNQPDFSWVYGLVEDDQPQPEGCVVGQPNLLEDRT